MSVALPQYQFASRSNVYDQQENLEPTPDGTADIIKSMLQDFDKSFSSQGTPMTKFNNMVSSLLPIGRAVILEKSITEDGYDTARYTKQQDDIEKLMPAILDTVKTVLEISDQTTRDPTSSSAEVYSKPTKTSNFGTRFNSG
ncbi:hypothetical protein Pcinc_038051 [Petrolisthes cinctipes]|uniref:Uncharacterized protein n=1 Tax=Petrolisthes cinctipes TaxID=88211 RepID=A0AAE1ELZ8_PETCI|nr:hypothetical protein Pcinc_038051 [Petrolisthes cinctipes]